MPRLDKLPVRPRKLAQTKLALLNAAVRELDQCTLEELSVRALCEAVEISEASFFNYFPKKSDLLVYFVQVWTLDVAWHALVRAPTKTARAAIARIFEVTAAQVAEHPGVMSEVLAGQARMRTAPVLAELTLAERVVAFPDRDGIETLPARGLDSLLPELIERAVRERELPAHTDVQSAFLGLCALFFGVPIVMLRVDPRAVGAAYRRQFDLYWTGLEHTPRTRRYAKKGG